MPYAKLAVAFALLVSTGARAAILSPSDYDVSRYLPPPPATDSVHTQDELAELRAIHARSTPEAIANATRDAKNETPTLFNGVMGFDLTTMPLTFRLLSDVADEEDVDSKVAKAFFHRERPYSVDPTLKTCTPFKPGKAANSYPSGHSTVAFAMATVLAELMSEKSQSILARADEFAENRLICGVHYRTDIAAGQQFGTLLALRLMERPDFQARMTAAKAELRGAGRTP